MKHGRRLTGIIKGLLAAMLISLTTAAAHSPAPAAGTAVEEGNSWGAEEWLQSLWEKGEKAFTEGRLEEANHAFQEALSLDPENGRTWNYLGGVSFARKDYYQALMRFKRAVRASPKDSRIFNNLATTYDHLGQYTNAIENYLRAVKLDPEYAVPYRNLGAIYAYKLKDAGLAVKYWGLYLQLAPDAPDAGEVEKELKNLEEGKPGLSE